MRHLGGSGGHEVGGRPTRIVTRIALQDRLAPGGTLPEKYESARRLGFDALELSERPAFDEARIAIRERIPVTAIAGGYRGWLIDPDPVRPSRRSTRLTGRNDTPKLPPCH